MKSGTQLPPESGYPSPEDSSAGTQIKHLLIGKPRDLRDRSIFHQLTLIPFLAWVGMGADGLSSSAYGPAEAFITLREHTYLAIAVALAMAITVAVISAGYSRIIEAFPHGGGGYVVATKLLGSRAGVVSGAALLVDYVLTITVSLAAAGDALFSIAPETWQSFKLPLECGAVVILIVLNLRGVRESVLVLTPIFMIFLITHLVLIGFAIGSHATEVPALARSLTEDFKTGHATLGLGGMLLLLLHAYSLGGGTYTGIEAVSNGLPLLREPRVAMGKRTMLYMAISLALTASGLLLSYLLVGIRHDPSVHKTLNAVLVERVASGFTFGGLFVLITLLSEGALLFVAAQTGFIDGPRVLANMAVDSWVPRRFAALSERLTTQNGILLMGAASMAALWYTQGNIHSLVVMYSINVFLTFTLSMLGMLKFSLTAPSEARRKRDLPLFGLGLVLCMTILAITVVEKFGEGGWLTLLVTGGLIGVCFLIRRHYAGVSRYLGELDKVLDRMPDTPDLLAEVDPDKPTAAVLVGGYGGLGIHTVLNIFRAFPGYYHNLAFLSVGVIDSGQFKGEQEMKALQASTKLQLDKYMELARRLGVPATYRWAIGTDAVAEAEDLCIGFLKEFPKTTFFAGQVIFQLENWYHRLLHNQTAFAVQKRLQMDGITVVILPVRVRRLPRRVDVK